MGSGKKSNTSFLEKDFKISFYLVQVLTYEDLILDHKLNE